MKKDMIILNDNHLDVEKVSFVGKPDLSINHHVTHPTKTYWFKVVIDGKDVTITANTFDELAALRNQLLFRLSI